MAKMPDPIGDVLKGAFPSLFPVKGGPAKAQEGVSGAPGGALPRPQVVGEWRAKKPLEIVPDMPFPVGWKEMSGPEQVAYTSGWTDHEKHVQEQDMERYIREKEMRDAAREHEAGYPHEKVSEFESGSPE